MNKNFYLVFDFETDSVDPLTCNAVELAAIPVEPRTLEMLTDESFSVSIKPEGIDDEAYFTKERLETIKWHAKCRNTTPEQIIENWKAGLNPKTAWENFVQYCKQYNIKRTRNEYWVEPIPVGFNIVNFDLIIAARMNEQFKTKFPFSSVKKVDIMDLLFVWFENLGEPSRIKMDVLRPFFSLSSEGTAHEALSDVIDEAKIFIKFLKFHRKQSSIKKFKGAFDERSLIATT